MINRREMQRVLLDLRVSLDDADAITADMMRSPSRRELGPVLHRNHYREAREKILAQVAYLMRMAEDPLGGEGVPTH